MCLGVLDFPGPGGSGTLKLLSGDLVLPKVPECEWTIPEFKFSAFEISLVDICLTGLAMPVIGCLFLECLLLSEP